MTFYVACGRDNLAYIELSKTDISVRVAIAAYSNFLLNLPEDLQNHAIVDFTRVSELRGWYHERWQYPIHRHDLAETKAELGRILTEITAKYPDCEWYSN